MDKDADTTAARPRYEDVNTSAIMTIGIVSVILLLEIVVGVQAWFYNVQEQEAYRKDIAQPNWELRDLVLQQKTDLVGGYRWIDREKQWVAIPIDVAMERFVEQAATRPASAASPPS